MTGLFLGAATFLLGTILVGMIRILRGPTPADAMLAAMLFGSTGVGVLLLLSQILDAPPLRLVALLLALLAAVTAVTFSRLPTGAKNERAPRP